MTNPKLLRVVLPIKNKVGAVIHKELPVLIPRQIKKLNTEGWLLF